MQKKTKKHLMFRILLMTQLEREIKSLTAITEKFITDLLSNNYFKLK